MPEIRCPKCGEVFQVDETGYDQIAQQVRDKEFEGELERRRKELDAKHEQALEVIRLQEEKEHTASMTQKDAEISEKDRRIAALQAKLDASETAKKLAVAEAVEKKNEELSQKVTEIADLRGELKNRETESRLSEKSLQEFQIVRNQQVDIRSFEENMNAFKEGFARNYRLASEKFSTAIDEIDKTIDHLQKTKAALLSSENNLRLANNKADELSIKKLIKNAPSVKAMFDDLKREDTGGK